MMRFHRAPRAFARLPSRRAKTFRKPSENFLINRRRAAQFLLRPLDGPTRGLIVPTNVIETVRADFEAESSPPLQRFFEGRADRPGRQERPRKNGPPAVDGNRVRARHLFGEAAVAKHAGSRPP